MNYTLSVQAHTSLLGLLTKPPSKRTEWRRSPIRSIDVFGKAYVDNPPSQDKHEGLGHSLRLLAQHYDLRDFLPNPDPSTRLYYNPSELPAYFQQTTLALRDDPDYLSNNELLDYKQDLSKLRKQRWISLDDSTRLYYSNLLVFLHIELPLRPNMQSPWIARQRDNLTSRVSFCLEAIGTKHILLPADYQYVIQQPNLRKDHSSKRYKALNARVQQEQELLKLREDPTYKSKPLFGNHEHTPYIQKKWIRLPAKPSNFTQEHVDFCCEPHMRLEDLAYEACQLNPDLIYRPQRALPIPSSEPTLSMPVRAKPRRSRLSLPQSDEPVYSYQGRDVTEACLKAYEIVYINGFNFLETNAIQTEYGIPYNALRLLVHREHVRRLMNSDSTSTSTSTDTEGREPI